MVNGSCGIVAIMPGKGVEQEEQILGFLQAAAAKGDVKLNHGWTTQDMFLEHD